MAEQNIQKPGILRFRADDGTEMELYVEEQARVNGTDYLLASDSPDGDASAFIFKDISKAGDEEAVYVPVEDTKELEALLRVFSELLEDTEIDM